jgi:hypothetical protein
MKRCNWRIWPLALIGAASLSAAACGDSPTDVEPDINPALLEAANNAGLGSGLGTNLPQGSAPFTGPGGLQMDATAEEFIQQLTFDDGVVWRTSGVTVTAVPDETVSNPVFDRMHFFSANTGSLESVKPGTYQLTGPLPTFDFIQQVRFAGARIRPAGLRDYVDASSGVLTIQSMNYFRDVYPCSIPGNVLVIDRCDYQLGVLRGVVEFRVTLASGEIVQERTSFSIPIQRRTIFARMK